MTGIFFLVLFTLGLTLDLGRVDQDLKAELGKGSVIMILVL